MAVFRDSEQFYECVGALMDQAKKEKMGKTSDFCHATFAKHNSNLQPC